MNQIKEPSKCGGSAIAMFVIITINSLAKESDFFATLICKKSNFSKDMIRRSALLGSSGTGNNAIGTEFITAKHDANKSLERIGPHRSFSGWVVTFEAAFNFILGSIRSTEAESQLRLAR